MTGLPFNLFDVLVRLNGQTKAAFETTAFQDIAPAFGGHALAEAVHAYAAAFFRLVSSFGGHTFSSQKFE